STEEHVVVLLHGIRDFAGWHNNVRAVLERHGFAVELTNYERLDLLRFLVPISHFRKQVVDRIQGQIEQIYTRHPGSRVSFIAHSFGTYALAHVMLRKSDFRSHRIVLCGSVLPYTFPFENLTSRFHSPILNEIGTKDIWPAVAQSVTIGYGS